MVVAIKRLMNNKHFRLPEKKKRQHLSCCSKHFQQEAFLLLGQEFCDCQPKWTLGTRSLGKASRCLLVWVGLAPFAFGCPWVNCCFPFGFLDSPKEQKLCAGEERKFKLLKKEAWSYPHGIFFSICICRWSQEPMKRVCVLELLTQWGKGRWGFLSCWA